MIMDLGLDRSPCFITDLPASCEAKIGQGCLIMRLLKSSGEQFCGGHCAHSYRGVLCKSFPHLRTGLC